MLPIPFDNPDTYPGHSGVDFGQSRGTPFRASGPGIVTSRGWTPRGGYTIWVRYDIGCEVGYVHMDSHDGCPPEGTRVVEGSQLGYVGNSGNSTGPHLHAEVEGYATTAGFWQWFTPDRVVGHDAPSKDTAAPAAPVPEEETDMLTIRWNQTHLFTVGPRFLEHETDMEQAKQAGWLFNRNDRMGHNVDGTKSLFVEVGNEGLNRIQRSLALPWYAFDLVMAGRGFDLEGNYGKGRIWSKEDEILAAVQGIRIRTDGLAKSLDELVAKVER